MKLKAESWSCSEERMRRTMQREKTMADLRDKNNGTSEDHPELDETRRAALAKMGRFAGYTAPAMLGLLGASKVRAQADGSVITPPPPP
jgi:hypothetical protein